MQMIFWSMHTDNSHSFYGGLDNVLFRLVLCLWFSPLAGKMKRGKKILIKLSCTYRAHAVEPPRGWVGSRRTWDGFGGQNGHFPSKTQPHSIRPPLLPLYKRRDGKDRIKKSDEKRKRRDSGEGSVFAIVRLRRLIERGRDRVRSFVTKGRRGD